MREMGKVYKCPKSGKHTEVKSALSEDRKAVHRFNSWQRIPVAATSVPSRVTASSASPAPSLTREKKERADKEAKALPASEHSQSAVSTEVWVTGHPASVSLAHKRGR